jgi:hypothetical protein
MSWDPAVWIRGRLRPENTPWNHEILNIRLRSKPTLELTMGKA